MVGKRELREALSSGIVQISKDVTIEYSNGLYKFSEGNHILETDDFDLVYERIKKVLPKVRRGNNQS